MTRRRDRRGIAEAALIGAYTRVCSVAEPADDALEALAVVEAELVDLGGDPLEIRYAVDQQQAERLALVQGHPYSVFRKTRR